MIALLSAPTPPQSGEVRPGAGNPPAGDSPASRLLRDRLVEAGWAQVRTLARMWPRLASEVLAEELAHESEHSRATLPPIEPTPDFPKSMLSTYTSEPNHSRVRRLLDFVVDGDRVLDVGIGSGYVTSILLREGRLDYYCGIDLLKHCVTSTQRAVDLWCPRRTRARLSQMSAYDIDSTFIEEHRPSLVLMLEVIEHLPDPGLALRTLAESLEPETGVLFTVPMPGRLEGVWGHLSFFDQARITALCDAAELTVQHVEAVQNTWILVLASRSDHVLPRMLHALADRRPAYAADRQLTGYAFRQLDPCIGADAKLVGCAREGRDDSFEVPPGKEGGIRLAVNSPELTRIEIDYQTPECIQAIIADVVDSRGRVQVAWEWVITDRNRPRAGRRFSHVFRAGRPVGSFTVVSADGSLEGAAWFRFQLRAASGRTPARAAVHRAGFVPCNTE